MPREEFLERLRLVRRDLGNLLFHFTKPASNNVVIQRGSTVVQTNSSAPDAVLKKILTEGKIAGSNRFIRGNHRCVCFTEAPISELAALFSLARIAEEPSHQTRYEPYGIAVKKDWLFEKGGRPVIYQSDSEYTSLPTNLQYRHVRYEPGNQIDFTWEREWRIQADELIITPNNTLIVVPTAPEAFELTQYFCEQEPDDFDDEGMPHRLYEYPTWQTVSLDLFGLTED